MGYFLHMGDKPCPNCGKKVEWQSKDIWYRINGFEFDVLWSRKKPEDWKIDEHMYGEMHAYCMKEVGGCGMWIEADFEGENFTEIRVMKDFGDKTPTIIKP